MTTTKKVTWVTVGLVVVLMAAMLISRFRAPSAMGLPAGDELSAELETPPGYKIAPDDYLRVVLFQENDLSRVARVDSMGKIWLSLIQSIEVGGLKIPEAQERIEQAYAKGFVRNPQVVLRLSPPPQEVNISGMVRHPRKISGMPGAPLTLEEALLKAGGLAANADPTQIRISRKNEVFKKNVGPLTRWWGVFYLDKKFSLEAGDVIYVPVDPKP